MMPPNHQGIADQPALYAPMRAHLSKTVTASGETAA